MASFSSAALNLSTVRPQTLPSPRSFSVSSIRHSHYNPSRRLTPFHLGAALPQSHLFGAKGSELFKAEGQAIEATSARKLAEPNVAVSEQNLFDWVQKDERRLIHAVYRVGDLNKTIKFYTECLRLKLLRKYDMPEKRHTIAFLGRGPEDSHFVVELSYHYGVHEYGIGTGFGHFGIAVTDVARTVNLIKAKGGKVTREPGPVDGSTVIASIEDPDGYTFELVEKAPSHEPLYQVMLRVGDLDRAIVFYQKAFGMQLLHKRDYPEYKYTIAKMGYGPEDKSTVLKLTYNYGVTKYDKGDGFVQITIGTNDVYKTAEAVKLSGGTIVHEPGFFPGTKIKVVECLDPDGWKSVFVDNADFLTELNQRF